MKKLLLAFLFAVIASAGTAHALFTPPDGIEPPAGLIVNSGGLEWVWASGCAWNAKDLDNCGTLHLHHNFAVPTTEQWNLGFSSLDALIAAFIPASGAPPKCAASFFVSGADIHNDCNPEDITGDVAAGVPQGGVYGAPFFSQDPLWLDNAQYADQFLVRAVPEPASMILLGIGLLAFAAWKRKGLKS